MNPFHLAVPVTDLAETRRFYTQTLGLPIGREDERWLDIDFFGHQVTLHLTDTTESSPTNAVDGEDVPVRHFGVVVSLATWDTLAAAMREAKIGFVIEPVIRFAGEIGEQRTFFVRDPSGNVLEFKSFADPDMLFRRD
ncbi:MAG: VOC family protein [Pseudomonadota bacterium]